MKEVAALLGGKTLKEVGKDKFYSSIASLRGKVSDRAILRALHFFNEDGLGAIVNSSRGIIAAYKQDKYKDMGITEENFADASRAAVKDMVADISGALASR